MPEQDFKIKIGTAVELRALRELEASLQKQIVQLRALGQSGTAAFKQLEAQLTSVQQEVGQISMFKKLSAEAMGAASRIPVLGEAMRALNGSLGPVSVALGGVAAALAMGKKALNEYAQAEENMAALDAVLAQNGRLTDEYREKLQALAGQMQANTAIADDQWLNVLMKLTQFGADESNIGRYTEAVKNLAGIIGGDIESAAVLFAKAMQGNYDMLGRYGIRIEKTGDKVKDMDRLMELVAQRGGGVLEARAQTLNGKFRQLGNAISDTWEALGRGIAKTGTVQKVLDVLSGSFEYWAEALGGPIEKVGELTNKIGELSNEEEASRKSAEGMADSLKKVEDASASTTKQLTSQITEIKRLRQAQDEIDDASMALEIAGVDADTGLTDIEKLQKKSGIRSRYDQQKHNRAQAADEEIVSATRSAMSDRYRARNVSISDVRTQQRRVKDATDLDEQETAGRQKAAGLTSNREQLEKRLAELRGKINSSSTGGAYGSINVDNLVTPQELEEMRRQAAQLETLAAKLAAVEQAANDAVAAVVAERKEKGLGSGEAEAEVLKDVEKKDVKARTDIDNANLADAEKIRLLHEEIALREKLYELKTGAARISDDSGIAKAEKSAADRQASEQRKTRRQQVNQLLDTEKDLAKRKQLADELQGLEFADIDAANVDPVVREQQKKQYTGNRAFAEKQQAARQQQKERNQLLDSAGKVGDRGVSGAVIQTVIDRARSEAGPGGGEITDKELSQQLLPALTQAFAQANAAHDKRTAALIQSIINSVKDSLQKSINLANSQSANNRP
jgi:hypothetical protein